MLWALPSMAILLFERLSGVHRDLNVFLSECTLHAFNFVKNTCVTR